MSAPPEWGLAWLRWRVNRSLRNVGLVTVAGGALLAAAAVHKRRQALALPDGFLLGASGCPALPQVLGWAGLRDSREPGCLRALLEAERAPPQPLSSLLPHLCHSPPTNPPTYQQSWTWSSRAWLSTWAAEAWRRCWPPTRVRRCSCAPW